MGGLGDNLTSEEIPSSSSVINQGLEEEEKTADGSFPRCLQADGVNGAAYFITVVRRTSPNHLSQLLSRHL